MALQKFTLHAEWYAESDSGTLFGTVSVPSTCAVHIHVTMELDSLITYELDEDTSQWLNVADEAIFPPIAYGLAKQLKSLHVVLKCDSCRRTEFCVPLERLAGCEHLSHATFEDQAEVDSDLTVSIQNWQQAPDCLQSIAIHFGTGRVPPRFKLNHDGWKRERQAATHKQRQFRLVRK